MRILALDVGSKRIGVAISDPTASLARTLTVIRRTKLAADMAAIAQLVRAEGAERVVVGLPLSLTGEVGPQARLTFEFKEVLQRSLDVPVVTWDESFSTKSAERILQAQGVRGRRQRARIDATAAAFILQTYLDNLDSHNVAERDTP